MPSNRRPPVHRVVAADGYRVPPPFRTYAVRSDEPGHAWDARAPYGRVHAVRTGGLDGFPDAGSLASLAADGRSRVSIEAFSDIDYATTTLAGLAAAAPRVPDLIGSLAGALQLTGVLGADPTGYRRSVATRIDYLAACGAGFHNDVSGHWSRCLFWLLALDLADVEFVMPHAGVRLALAPGDLLVFDPTMAHGLCRPGDGGQAVAASFEAADHRHQIFLTGELLLTDAQWAALDAPWLPVEVHQQRGALDLMVAEFDERSGAIKRVNALRDGMKRSTCHVDEPPARRLRPWHDGSMDASLGDEQPQHHSRSAHRPAARYLIVIEAGGSAVARLLLESREPVAEFDAGAEEAGQMAAGLVPVIGASGPEWDRALAGHSALERAAAAVYTLAI